MTQRDSLLMAVRLPRSLVDAIDATAVAVGSRVQRYFTRSQILRDLVSDGISFRAHVEGLLAGGTVEAYQSVGKGKAVKLTLIDLALEPPPAPPAKKTRVRRRID